jgi:hypothetical protein
MKTKMSRAELAAQLRSEMSGKKSARVLDCERKCLANGCPHELLSAMVFATLVGDRFENTMAGENAQLPYEFDLWHDIKTLGGLYDKIRLDEDSCNCTWSEHVDLEKLMIIYNVPFPKKYKRLWHSNFPEVIWIDGKGNYVTEDPKDNKTYQRMKVG